jgi:hypothetical protein
MTGAPSSFVFTGVSVGLPAKVRGNEAEDEWQEVDWVSWTTGKLTVHSDSYLLSFKPSSGGGESAVKPKLLGNLIKASEVAKEGVAHMFAVTTSDALHRLYRFTFESAADANSFSQLAASAEAAAKACPEGAAGPSGDASAREEEQRLKAEIRESMENDGRPRPLIYSGVELYGPCPGGDESDEVLLGSGAVVLRDPPESTKSVGTYELLFFSDDEGSRKATKSFTIGPKTFLKRQAPAGTGAAGEEDDAPAATLQLSSGLPGAPLHTFTFRSESVAEGLLRDFRVRQRLMEMSLKTVKSSHSAKGLRDEIEEMKQRSLGARLRLLVRVLILLGLLAAVVRLALLYTQDKGARPPVEYLKVLAQEARDSGRLAGNLVASASSKACEVATGCVAAPDVRRCVALGSKSFDVVRCLEALVGVGD